MTRVRPALVTPLLAAALAGAFGASAGQAQQAVPEASVNDVYRAIIRASSAQSPSDSLGNGLYGEAKAASTAAISIGDGAGIAVRRHVHPQSEHEQRAGIAAPHARVPGFPGPAAPRLRQGAGAAGGVAPRFGGDARPGDPHPMARSADPVSPPVSARGIGGGARGSRRGRDRTPSPSRTPRRRAGCAGRAQARRGRVDRDGTGLDQVPELYPAAARAISRLAARAGSSARRCLEMRKKLQL